ncbi:MAG: sigma-70 family RNA polymerase sigma factor, partial [Acidobacteriota bacterium]
RIGSNFVSRVEKICAKPYSIRSLFVTMNPPTDLTRLLEDWGNGDQTALDKLIPLVYDALHQLADRYLRHEDPNHTIQATALVHEAYLRLINQRQVKWQNRQHFFGIAAKLMRRILINYARDQKAAKRGGGIYKVSLSKAAELNEEPDFDLLALNDALDKLAEKDPRKSELIELRFFSGLSLEEAAEVLDISVATAKRDWRLARAWLNREIKKDSNNDNV